MSFIALLVGFIRYIFVNIVNYFLNINYVKKITSYLLVDPLEIFQREVMGTKRLLDGKTILRTKSYGYIFISLTFYYSNGIFTLLLHKSINNKCLNGLDNILCSLKEALWRYNSS